MRLVATKRPHGFSLIEVLVALIVLSVGMLSIAELLVQGVRGNRSAHLRTQAVDLVSDMADRIRARGSADDLAAWQADVRAALRGEGEVNLIAGSPDAYDITVQWREPESAQPFSYTSQVVRLRGESL